MICINLQNKRHVFRCIGKQQHGIYRKDFGGVFMLRVCNFIHTRIQLRCPNGKYLLLLLIFHDNIVL